jgi:hypothetical protein
MNRTRPPPPAAIDELVVFPRLVRLLSRDPNRDRDRFYELRWDRSLVNDPVLVRS